MATKPNHALIYRRIPAFLTRMREDAGLTQRQFAAKVGKPQWWVARTESGSRRADVAEFVLWCGGCGIMPDEALRDLAQGLR